MNIFYLHREPIMAAQAHCDKHVCKMILEYAQMLSTAHRVLDGIQTNVPYWDEDQQKMRMKRVYLLKGEGAMVIKRLRLPAIKYKYVVQINGAQCFREAMINHPSNVWVRAHQTHYVWLLVCFTGLLMEYRHRYGRRHAVHDMLHFLIDAPKNIPIEGDFSAPPLIMPDKYKVEDAVLAYQNLYVGDKARFARYTNRQPPEWFTKRIPEYDPTYFTRTNNLAA
jgi:hypothetical protein